MSAQEGRAPKVLSCASCRQRKIKCDKTQPNCNNCSRASLRCVYPSRKPTRRAPRPRQNELLDRISRLESIVGKANPEKLAELDGILSGEGGGGDVVTKNQQPQSKARSSSGQAAGAGTVMTKSASRAVDPSAEETAGRYMGGDFWLNLCEEVEGIKQALQEPSEDEEDEENGETPRSHETMSSTSSDISRAFLFGNTSGDQTRPPNVHPSRDMVLKLWNIYCRNIDPVIKILHRPTITREISVYFDSIFSDPLPAAKSALLFAIYFAAVTSLSPEECMKQLGEKRDDLQSKLRIDLEQALLTADLLNTNELTVLQAVTIYVAALRVSSRTRAPWVLAAMVVRIAQGMNLHRDGDGHGFSPFEAEMRRRVWCVVVNLDLRAAEDRGTAAVLNIASATTKPPTPIDDDDFSPESSGPLRAKESGQAENIITILLARLAPFGFISHAYVEAHRRGEDSNEDHLHTEEDLIQLVRSLESEFIHNADPGNLASRYASEVTRLCILKLWLIVQYPFSQKPTVAPMRVSRETMLRTAVSVMELSLRMSEPPWVGRFSWWTETYVQWHPLAVALAELCVQTEGELVARAWTVVDTVFPLWRDLVADASSGPLWRPVKKLYKKAREARAKSGMKGLQLAENLGTMSARPPPPQQKAPAHTRAQMIPTTTATTTSSPSIPSAAQQQQQQQQPPPNHQTPTQHVIHDVPGYSTFDTMGMDPSCLFSYPPELTDMNMSPGMGPVMNFDMAPWNEFLIDTQMDYSPGSGRSDST